LEPVQFSAASHGPAEARQTVLDDLKASAGQVALVPVQFSATSHTPAEARQTVLEDRKLSAGQLALVPVQFSAPSHTPAEARQTVPALPAGCWQILLLPSQVSVVHGLPSSEHAVPLALNVQVAEQQEPAVPLVAPSSHCSPASIRPLPHTT